MDTSLIVAAEHSGFQLSFRPVCVNGRGFAFPCDAAGRVNIDELSEAARNNYLYARAVIGREFFVPVVAPTR